VFAVVPIAVPPYTKGNVAAADGVIVGTVQLRLDALACRELALNGVVVLALRTTAMHADAFCDVPNVNVTVPFAWSPPLDGMTYHSSRVIDVDPSLNESCSVHAGLLRVTVVVVPRTVTHTSRTSPGNAADGTTILSVVAPLALSAAMLAAR
jgi:hypothetical protein